MRAILINLSILGTLLFTSCGKDFLNVSPSDNLTGNNYWKSESDVDKFMVGIYKTFRLATMGTPVGGEGNHRIFFPATGDFRCAPIERTSQSSGSGRNYLTDLKTNNLNALIGSTYSFFGFSAIPKWNDFFKMVQAANIVYYEMDNMEEGLIAASSVERYKAEAVFLRNLAYFFMVRLYGDVPYYTEAYHSKAIGRTNMLAVLESGLEDMKAHYKNLPWTYEDPSIVGNRAMRGAAITLMMHMNMWIAGFTPNDKSPYYTATIALGEEIMNENENSYELLPLERTKEIFKGRTREGLFEIVQSLNYNETFSISSPYADYFLRYPNKNVAIQRSYLYYNSKFMEELYPLGGQDRRKEIWYDEYIYNTAGMMQCLKFLNVFNEEGEDYNPDDNQVVFRYVDPILLRAEALAELDRDAEARTIVNIVRERAGATLAVSEVGEELKDFIWWERVRELIGEGHFFYDLVRTRKILNTDYTSAAMSVDAFNRGGWTWPIDRAALVNNPFMTLNNYWN
ncbi:Starch-binding associating with outer membrane [Sphingobacterium nematocida]|uniref:Starch-binding associating with outer membrane n=1 Tax=Sphingobacterium nematocida TaxID=1513896 RepID=A0A1T5GGW6_9SPHI|nr:RagB/SusD family nutrient uptake outer membrane protein [Sphingobacterium nematocida]SKC07684.1 Starch-binding associating with outer membrane [Sphingobacterium nematocida]